MTAAPAYLGGVVAVLRHVAPYVACLAGFAQVAAVLGLALADVLLWSVP